MGWLAYHRPAGHTDRQHFQHVLPDGEQIVECATIRNVFYAAVRTTATGQVWALIILLQRARGEFNFAYKDMDETMGPVDAHAPARVLDALTPTDSDSATRWRQRCRDNAASAADARQRQKAVAAGVTIRTAIPVTFSGGRRAQEFLCQLRTGRTIVWQALPENGAPFPCSLGSTWASRLSWEIVPPPPPESPTGRHPDGRSTRGQAGSEDAATDT